MNHGVWLRGDDDTGATDLIGQAVAAEAAGWDGVFVSDSLPYTEFPDPWVLLAGMATRTEAVTLGTWLVPVPRRQPYQVALEVATLDRLSKGRVLMGCGLGNDPDYPAYGTPYDLPTLGKRFDEALDVITDLWAGEPVTFDGEFFSLEAAEVHPTPVQEPHPPLLMGAWWPNKKPFHRGARYDGIMPFMASLTSDETGPHGEEPTGSPIEEVRAMMDYYNGITDDPGEVLLPMIPTDTPGEYIETCEGLGATWILTTDIVGAHAEAAIRDGPPG